MRRYEDAVLPSIRISPTQIMEVKDLFGFDAVEGLEKCIDQGFEPWFMPQLVKERIEKPKDDPLWLDAYTAPGLMAMGKTGQGLEVVVYAHVPNYFCQPVNHFNIPIMYERIRKKEALEKKRDYHFRDDCYNTPADALPEEEFKRLLELEDNKNVFVVDYSKFLNFTRELKGRA